MNYRERIAVSQHETPPQYTLEELETKLRQSGIPIDTWGQGRAKTTAHLLAEVESGESLLEFTPTGEVKRQVSVIWVDVLHVNGDGQLYLLRETRQVFDDGRIRQRQLPASLGEKMTAGEGIEAAARRALLEEIGIANPTSLDFSRTEPSEYAPESYPGLLSIYETHFFVAELSAADFKPGGYIEIQPDKTNYYEWERAS